jgi:hypothetical protein
MAKIEFRDWEAWKTESFRQSRRSDVLDYLHDNNRVNGAGLRVFQFLVLPSRLRAIRAYDVYINEAPMWEANSKPSEIKLIRCQLKNQFTSSPKFEYKFVDFPLHDFRKLHEDLQALVMPHVFSQLVYHRGFDGADYEFEFNNPVVCLRYGWWSVPTEEIRPLADYCYKMAQSFEKLLKQAPKDE